MFRRLDKFDGPRGAEVIFGKLIGLHIWGAYIRGIGRDVLTEFYSI